MKNKHEDHKGEVKGVCQMPSAILDVSTRTTTERLAPKSGVTLKVAEADPTFPAGKSLPPLPASGFADQAAWEERVVGPDLPSPCTLRQYEVKSSAAAPIDFVPTSAPNFPHHMSGLLQLRVIRLARAVKNHRWPSSRNYTLKVLKSFVNTNAATAPYHFEARAANLTLVDLVDRDHSPIGDDLSDLGVLGEQAGFEYILFVPDTPNYLHMAVANSLRSLWEQATLNSNHYDDFPELKTALWNNGWTGYLEKRRRFGHPHPTLPPDARPISIQPSQFPPDSDYIPKLSQGEILLRTAEFDGCIPKVYFEKSEDRYDSSRTCKIDLVPSTYFGMPDIEQVSLESLQISLRSISDEGKPLRMTYERELQVVIDHFTNPRAKILGVEGGGRYRGIVFDIPQEIASTLVKFDIALPAGGCLKEILDSLTAQTASQWHWTGRNQITIGKLH